MSFGKQNNSTRLGFTLIEVMIAISITLLILLAMMQAFTVASKDISQGRNRVILAERMESVTDMIRSDLEQLSLNVEPIVSGKNDVGYFEYVDGAFRDMTFSQIEANSAMGDFDDILAFTVRSTGQPFRGRYGVYIDPDGSSNSGDEYVESTIIESMEAEVIYFTVRTDPGMNAIQRRIDGSFFAGEGQANYGDQIRLYRRVLLVRPDLDNTNLQQIVVDSTARYDAYVSLISGPARLLNRSAYAKFLQFNDVSLRYNADDNEFVPNSLSTLTHPKNRTAHDLVNFPHPMLVADPRDTNAAAGSVGTQTYLSDLVSFGIMAGNDVIMENVIAFDVKVFDPNVDVYEYAGSVVTADDPGFISLRNAALGAGTVPNRGSFVDLGAMEYRTTAFSPAITDPPPFVAAIPTQTPVPAGVTAADNYQFAFWDGDGLRDLSAEPAANYYSNLFAAYQTFSGGPVYTTWPDTFESDGIDTDGDGVIDEGGDGIASNGVPEIFSDADSAPPYLFPVTAVKVVLRTASYDADRQKISASDQVIQRQVVVSTTNQ